jgi:hypothetical protein
MLRDALLRRVARDQEWRTRDLGAMSPDDRAKAFRDGREVDRDNTAWLQDIVAKHGWPTRSIVGDDGAHAAFVLVQHADHVPEFQAQCLPLLEEAGKRGEVKQADVALLTDRVRVKQRRPQLYGSQYYVREDASGSVVADASGKPTYLLPIVEDVHRLDERRAAVGLPPWSEYERRMAADQGRPAAERPRTWHGSVPVDPQR